MEETVLPLSIYSDHIIQKPGDNGRGWSAGADSFADIQIHCDSNEAKALGGRNDRE